MHFLLAAPDYEAVLSCREMLEVRYKPALFEGDVYLKKYISVQYTQ